MTRTSLSAAFAGLILLVGLMAGCGSNEKSNVFATQANTPTLAAGTAPATATATAKQPYCDGSPFAIFDNYNIGGVVNGGQAPKFDTTRTDPKQKYCLVKMETYHWNGAKGAAPGTIGLTDANGAQVPGGPWTATAVAGQNSAPNVSWTAVVAGPQGKPVIIAGAYTVNDSSPATWSGNAQSVTNFARVWVEKYIEPN